MAKLIEIVEWENDRTRLVRLVGLPVGSRPYKVRRGRTIKAVYGHHSAGNRKTGQAAAIAIARFHTSPPKYNAAGRWIGGGRGWPGAGYHIVVPSEPEVQDGRLVAYRTATDDTHTYHTGPGHNTTGIGVVVAGCFQSRHRLNDADDDVGPSASAAAVFEDVVQHLLAVHGLTPEKGLKGHFDAGKPTCPGDWLEQLIRHLRGENFPHPKDRLTIGQPQIEPGVLGVKDRQKALISLGYYLGPAGADGIWGPASREGLRAFQKEAGLVVDGVWGPRSSRAVAEALTSRGAS